MTDLEQRLFNACNNGNLDDVKRILPKKNPTLDINSTDADSRTPLHLACRNGNVEVVKYLLEIGAEVNITDKKFQTPLHLASFSGSVEAVESLMRDGRVETIDAQDQHGYTPLHWASKHGHAEVVEVLLEHGADTEIKALEKYHEDNPLRLAAVNCHMNVILSIITEKSSNDTLSLPDAIKLAEIMERTFKQEHGNSKLHKRDHNFFSNFRKIVRMLSDAGVDCNLLLRSCSVFISTISNKLDTNSRFDIGHYRDDDYTYVIKLLLSQDKQKSKSNFKVVYKKYNKSINEGDVRCKQFALRLINCMLEEKPKLVFRLLTDKLLVKSPKGYVPTKCLLDDKHAELRRSLIKALINNKQAKKVDLANAGFSDNELNASGLIKNGCSRKALVEAGFSEAELKASSLIKNGCSRKALLKAGFSCDELKASSLLENGCSHYGLLGAQPTGVNQKGNNSSVTSRFAGFFSSKKGVGGANKVDRIRPSCTGSIN